MLQIETGTELLSDAIERACLYAEKRRDEFVTPEHILWAIAHQNFFFDIVGDDRLILQLEEYLQSYSTTVPYNMEYSDAEPSEQLVETANLANKYAIEAQCIEIDVPHIVQAIFRLKNSFAHDSLSHLNITKKELIKRLYQSYTEFCWKVDDNNQDENTQSEKSQAPYRDSRQLMECINFQADERNPLIGREEEIERTIQVLCRKDKNNPLHVGEPGVGKTALAYGLAARIQNEDRVPDRLKGRYVYRLDLAALTMGMQYRGDFEKRIKMAIEEVLPIGKPIIFVDDIHNLVGSGNNDNGTLDAATLLKPYLDTGAISIMGATTYEEYNRIFLRNKAFARRFEKIDIAEPSVEQCILILKGLKKRYEDYHHITYTDEAIEYAVKASAKYISGRFLPDKAIDLIDEAGAWREIHPAENHEGQQTVDRKLISEVLARICNVESLADNENDSQQLAHLEEKIRTHIYGQDEAVKEVVKAVQMAQAGLSDDNKPMASLLFVGPTGVGKTEVARVLAKELSLPLIRFDMSEYAEKHTVAKLIGSPAGYVGYDDGGLLTDAIRKSPHCVLLFDELEKAHQDIYNILLQVMDYAVLTDNKGHKADFRHVIFIMTTNAGAQFARQANIGFNPSTSAGNAMLKDVRKTFKPEFINRLTNITVFHDMNRDMAQLILNKKLRVLNEKLASRNVTLTLSDEAREKLLLKGFSEEYGGREIDRVINSELKPLLMESILFGKLKDGGAVTVGIKDNKLTLEP